MAAGMAHAIGSPAPQATVPGRSMSDLDPRCRGEAHDRVGCPIDAFDHVAVPYYCVQECAADRLQHTAFDLVRYAVGVHHLAAIMAGADAGHANLARAFVDLDFGDRGDVGDRVVVTK